MVVQPRNHNTVMRVASVLKGLTSALLVGRATAAYSTTRPLNSAQVEHSVPLVKITALFALQATTVLLGQKKKLFVGQAPIVTWDQARSTTVQQVTTAPRAHQRQFSAIKAFTLPQVLLLVQYARLGHFVFKEQKFLSLVNQGNTARTVLSIAKLALLDISA